MPSAVDPEPQKSEGRLLLISNRLPITIKRSNDNDNRYETSMSSGGLVSGLSGLRKTTTFQWYGWPGLEVPEDEVEGLKDQLKREYNAVPVMLDDDLADRHYNGFSSKCCYHMMNIRLTLQQMRSFGLFFITIQVKLPLMNQPGKHTRKQIVYSQRPSLRIYKTMIWYGCMTII